MADFGLEKSAPFEGCDLPQSLGAARLQAVGMGAIFSIAPLKGQRAAVEAVLGAALPDIGQVSASKNAETVWFGPEQWFVFVEKRAEWLDRLADIAALTDQSDGWQVMALSGHGAGAVLARLCPLDFDALPSGCVARSEFAHVPAMIIPRDESYWIALPRSFAQSVVAQTLEAMKSVAAQALL